MSVLQIVKDYIGEEDINWGDSDVTFNRQTHTGGTVVMHYVDSKSIPANSLGGVVDTHLHTQNTDTGTIANIFYINFGATAFVALSSVGQVNARVFTFPTSASQALAGVTDLASTSTGRGASTIGVEDSGGHFSAGNVETVLAELATSVEAVSAYRGYKRGFKLGYSSTSTITISGGMWDHSGTTQQNVFTNSQIAFVLGSAGSNADSEDLGASELHYIYIDDSAVVLSGTALMIASGFLNSTTAPTWSNSKAGWYNGLDRCIGVVLTNSSSQIVEFAVSTNDYYSYTAATSITAYASAAAPTSGTDLDLSAVVPVFSTNVRLHINSATAGTAYSFGITTGHNWDTFYINPSNDSWDTITTATSSAQIAYWDADAATVTVLLLAGFYQGDL